MECMDEFAEMPKIIMVMKVKTPKGKGKPNREGGKGGRGGRVGRERSRGEDASTVYSFSNSYFLNNKMYSTQSINRWRYHCF